MSTKHPRPYPRVWFLTPQEALASLAPDKKITLLTWLSRRPRKTRTNMFDMRRKFLADAGIYVGMGTMKGALDTAGRKAIWGTRGWREPDYMASRLAGEGAGGARRRRLAWGRSTPCVRVLRPGR